MDARYVGQRIGQDNSSMVWGGCGIWGEDSIRNMSVGSQCICALGIFAIIAQLTVTTRQFGVSIARSQV